MNLKETATHARLELRRLVSPYPSLFLPLMRARSTHGDNVINSLTEIMIEGAPRSGNTFAVAAFEHAQDRPVSIARHLHGAGHVIEGIRRGLPILVVCRNPGDSVISQVIRHPEMTLAHALRQWATFHEPLVSYLDKFVVGSFDEVTADFGGVVKRLNERFGTSFATFDHTDDNVEAVFARVDEMDRQDKGSRAHDSKATTARPVESREQLKKVLRSELRSTGVQGLLRRTEELHDRIINVSTKSDV